MMNYEKLAEIVAAENEAARRVFETANSLTFSIPSVQNAEQPSPTMWQPPLFPPASGE
jgi:hypothetical protein